MNGWLKIHRQLLNWQYYNNPVISRVFIHCLLKANVNDSVWKSINVPKGSFITSQKHLADDLGFTIGQIRHALRCLKNSKELNVTTNNRFTIIKINKWETYQYVSNDKEEEQPIQTSKPVNKTKPRNKLDTSFIAEEFKGVWDKWIDYKKKIGKNYKTEVGIKTKYNELVKLSDNDPKLADKIVQQSIENEYQGLFPLKTQYHKTKAESTMFDNVSSLSQVQEKAIMYIKEIGLESSEMLINNVKQIESNILTAQEYYGRYINKQHPCLEKCPDIDEYIDAYTIWLSNQSWLTGVSPTLFRWDNSIHQQFFNGDFINKFGDKVKNMIYTREKFEQMIKDKGV